MAKKSRKKKDDPKARYMAILWACSVGLWLLVAAAMISYAPADHPAHAFGVPNETVTTGSAKLAPWSHTSST